MNHCGFGGIFLVWITLVKALTGGHVPVWTFHSPRRWCRPTVDSTLCVTHYAGRSYLNTHTQWVKRRRMQPENLSPDWAEWNNILCILQITPIWSDIATVTKEMRTYQTITNDVKTGVGWCVSVSWHMTAITNSSCIIKTIIDWAIPVIFVGYSLFSKKASKGAHSCRVTLLKF